MATKTAGFRRKDTQRALDNAPIEVSNHKVTARQNEFGLTAKQEDFARLVAKGSSLADAYRASYDAEGMKDASVFAEASRMMDVPHIAARVRRLLDEANERHQVDAARIRRHVMDGLLKESVDFSDKSNANARIRALELLGKVDVVGMFKEHKAKDDDKLGDVDSLKAKLRKMLQEMTGIEPPIK